MRIIRNICLLASDLWHELLCYVFGHKPGGWAYWPNKKRGCRMCSRCYRLEWHKPTWNKPTWQSNADLARYDCLDMEGDDQ